MKLIRSCWIAILVLISSGLMSCSLLQRNDSSDTYAPDEQLIDFYRQKNVHEVQKAKSQLGIRQISLSQGERIAVHNRVILNRLENVIPTENEKKLYYDYKPYFPSDSARVSFLRTPNIAGKQNWLKQHRIDKAAYQHSPMIQQIISKNDISLGMTQEAVNESWGEPEQKEIAGNPIYGNERWRYNKYIPGASGFVLETRLVYFEGGRVSGWEKH